MTHLNPYLELADAMRRGSKIRPQCTGGLFDGTSSCAVGAICEGSGAALIDNQQIKLGDGSMRNAYVWVKTSFPIVNQMMGFDGDLLDLIWRKNDRLMMTREAIADWIESLGKESHDRP